MRNAIQLVALLAVAHQAAAYPHHLFDQVLQEHVDGAGRVDYAGLQRAPSLLQAYLDSLAAVSPSSHPE
ncbi:MAG: hypothetical protein AB1505_10100, partial [Candidatus Latescibacterota bacterium]